MMLPLCISVTLGHADQPLRPLRTHRLDAQAGRLKHVLVAPAFQKRTIDPRALATRPGGPGSGSFAHGHAPSSRAIVKVEMAIAPDMIPPYRGCIARVIGH